MKRLLFICIILCSTSVFVNAQTTYKVDYTKQVKECRLCKKTISADVPMKISMIENGTKSADMSSKVQEVEKSKLLEQYAANDGSCLANKSHDYVKVTPLQVSEEANFSNVFTYDNSELSKYTVSAKVQQYKAQHQSVYKDCSALISKAYTNGSSTKAVKTQ